MTSLSKFLVDEVRKADVPEALDIVLNDIGAACKEISTAIDRGALTGAMGGHGSSNVQGEEQKKLDVISNEIFIKHLKKSGLVAGVVSEELKDIQLLAEPSSAASTRYLVLFDPLDGSSNIDVNMAVGTIFSILLWPDEATQPTAEDFLHPGTKQVCAGYAVYGPSTMLVLTVGNGVNGFTLDRDSGEFLLTHTKMTIPADTQEFAINLSNYRFWEAPTQRYIDDCLQGQEGRRDKDFNMRWVASMVAEIHRILMRGGVFMYPLDSKTKKQGGRLRLMYEANPMSYIVEQAGGMSSTGRGRIMEIKPEDIHQRVSVAMGSRNEVELIASYYKR
jgi:fructose-1,6-bisphosphatase I